MTKKTGAKSKAKAKVKPKAKAAVKIDERSIVEMVERMERKSPPDHDIDQVLGVFLKKVKNRHLGLMPGMEVGSMSPPFVSVAIGLRIIALLEDIRMALWDRP